MNNEEFKILMKGLNDPKEVKAGSKILNKNLKKAGFNPDKQGL